MVNEGGKLEILKNILLAQIIQPTMILALNFNLGHC